MEAGKSSKFLTPVRISYKDPLFLQAELLAANKIDVWHKFIIFNVTMEEKNMVLDALIEACNPLFFFPIMFKMETKDKATFLTMCKSSVIQKLVNRKLQITLKNRKIVYYDIVLSFLPCKDMMYNPQQMITNAIKARYSIEQTTKKILNLEKFSEDYQLSQIYCPIHIPVIFDNILRYARSLLSPSSSTRDPSKLPIRDLILRSNNMETLVHSEKIFNFSFTKLDLRNNKLADLIVLKPFSEYKITELWLDGNPLCYNYETVPDYINAVRALFPSLQMLDGFAIGGDTKMLPIHHKHFINDKFKLNLIKQFLEHFFTCYDQDDRIVLNGLYDSGALFSMTVGPLNDIAHKNVIKSFAKNRNLLKVVDYAKCTEVLLHGPQKIIAALRREPATLHKLKYLDIDLLYSSNNSFAVSVQGPFLYRKHSISPMWFQRTLIVVAKEDNEFCIINDQYHLDNCPSDSYKYTDLFEVITDKSIPVFNPITFSSAEKNQLLRLLQELTTINPEHSEKFLREANWDIRQAIKTFMQNYANNKIAPEAFMW